MSKAIKGLSGFHKQSQSSFKLMGDYSSTNRIPVTRQQPISLWDAWLLTLLPVPENWRHLLPYREYFFFSTFYFKIMVQLLSNPTLWSICGLFWFSRGVHSTLLPFQNNLCYFLIIQIICLLYKFQKTKKNLNKELKVPCQYLMCFLSFFFFFCMYVNTSIIATIKAWPISP